jgi:phage terminase Nu1 subunit (DNA packaging protein)
MREFSGSELAEITGKSWRTIQRRLTAAGIDGERRGNATLYESVAALQAIYAHESTQADALDLGRERAALAQAQRLRIERQMKVEAGELIRVEDVLTAWAGHIGTVKQALLGLPAKCAGLVAPDRVAEAESILRREVKQALSELAGDGVPRNNPAHSAPGNQGD